MNQLGNQEFMNIDSCSWACKDEKGNIQVLFWDFTYTLPADSVNNQDYYIRDLPAKSKGNVDIKISGIPAGTYDLKIYKVGYRVNDSYTTYLDMGRPGQLTKAQVRKIKDLNDGSAISSEKIKVKDGATFQKELEIRENDVFLMTISKQ
jgi:xylan 1,4-beta-xylosidase